MTLSWPRIVRMISLDAAMFCAWLVAIGLVLLHEHGQLWGQQANPIAMLNATLEAKEQWFGLYYHNYCIGFTSTSISPGERQGMPGVVIRDQGRLSFTLLGVPQRMDVLAQGFIDANWRLQAVYAAISGGSNQVRWVGERHGDDLWMTVTTPESTTTRRIPDPSGTAFVNGLASWTAFHRLRDGQSGRAWVLNPLSLTLDPMFYHVRGRESVDGSEALVVDTDMAGLQATSWVTPAGEVLKERSPLGWELRRHTRHEVMREMAAASTTAPDLLTATAVPVNREIPAPERLIRVTLLIQGVTADQFAIARPWQRVLPPETLANAHHAAPDGSWCVVELRRPTIGASLTTAPEGPPRRYTQPSYLVQSDDPRIRAQAAQIVGTTTDPLGQAFLLNQWVYASLNKQLSIGLPSAVDVLSVRSGDCHEHTVLFTALARSLGVPTRMVAGLVYQGGRFYYHAWPEIWVHDWIPTDPTLGQPVADATHLAIAEAEDEQLTVLGHFVGQVGIEVLDVEESK